MKTIRELMSLQGRVALITGGAGHIGRAFCEALAEMGAAIGILDLELNECEFLADEINAKFGVSTMPMAVDLTNEEEIRTAPNQILKHLGRLDILVNCAAFVGTSDLKGWTTPFMEQSVDTWRKALDVNLSGPFVLIQACISSLRKSAHGSIINVCSTYVVVGPDMRLYQGTTMGNPAAYSVSKGGMVQFTRWLATVLAPEIRVNAISPGGIWRNQPEDFHRRYIERTPLGRMASEEDLKGAVVYLASDMSSYVTGQNLLVDGGWTSW
jgi:NAD(P)-dependent dehydrogenase (short-subunit alcohol dehydrogenase family)